MFFSVIIDLRSFLLMFFSFVSIFTMIQYILSGQADDKDYPGVHPFVSMFIQTTRMSVGDIQAINYINWADNPSVKDSLTFSSFAKGFVVYEVWAFWVTNIVLI